MAPLKRQYPYDLEPVEIKTGSSGEIIILWSDGHASLHSAEHLRKSCPCALCESSHTQSSLPLFTGSVRMLNHEPVGRYAIRFAWNDGHALGIYRYEYLRDLCQCDVCKET
ncbi:MAG: gamma-butyrobetaine hydroxylase-like domain-containing protein [Candidatus Bathyarchaeia archaeon]